MKRNTGKQVALLLPSFPCQALGQSEQEQVTVCYHVREKCFSKGAGDGWRSTEEAGKLRIRLGGGAYCWQHQRAERGNRFCNKEV